VSTRSALIGAALSVLLAACSASSPSRPPHVATADDATHAGRMHGYVTARRVSDFIMVNGKEQRREVEYGWDYDHGFGLQKTFDAQGKLLETEHLSGADLSLTPLEVERVHQLIHAQPDLKAIAGKSDVVIWGDGFAYREPDDPDCSAGSRCIHAILAADFGNTAVAHAIVDLQSDRVVHPFYHPSESDPIKVYGE
jgi:hypothetical protein